MDVSRQNSTLALLRRLMPIAEPSVPGYVPDDFVQLCDGISLYAVLHIVAPNTFPPITITAVTGDDGEETIATLSLTSRAFEPDAAMRRANLSVLLRRIAHYAKEAMGQSPTASSTTQGLDAASMAELAGGGSESGVRAATTLAPLMQLVGVTVTLVVLSGVQTVLAEVKTLPRQEQVVLSNWVRELMGVYDLKPRRYVAEHANSTSSGSPTSTAGSSAASSPTASHMPAARQPAPSGPPTATAPSPNGGAQPTPSRSVSVADTEDDGYYRNIAYQLNNELTAVKAQLTALQDEHRILKEDKETAENKYRLLLGEEAKASQSAVVTSLAASEGDGASENQKEVLALWQERCNNKDETIATLKARMEEQSAQVVALKEAAAAHEMALQTLRRRLKSAEEGVMVKSKEKREAEEKLAVAEDKLAMQMKARLELENQVEELNSRVLVLTLEQDRLRGADDENHAMNTSFASNGSVDRVMTLENELDEMRQQRDSLRRQVGILQRQLAAMPAPVADVSTANDTWKAQLRQVEREREDMRQQLTTALERNGDLQQQLAASAAAAATAAVANLRHHANRAIDAEGVTSPNNDGAGGVINTSVADGSELDVSSRSVNSPRCRATRGSISGKTRDAERREQIILSSLLLQYSYRNLLLQQHETLLHKDSADAAVARQHQVEKHLNIAHQIRTSVLTKQRRDVEQGLLESVLHGAKLRMMRVEQ